MALKTKKKDMNMELLDAIFQLEKELKQIRFMMYQSIEPTIGAKTQEALIKSKYMFLLREARRRNLSALD